MLFKIFKSRMRIVIFFGVVVISDANGGWMDDLPPRIEKVDKEVFHLPPEAENISISNHSGTVVCLFHLVSTYRPAKPGLSDITFTPGENFDGSLCTHVICTRLSLSYNLGIQENNEFRALPVVKQLHEKYPTTKFLLDVTVLPGGVYDYIGEPQYEEMNPFGTPTNPDAYAHNMRFFLDKVKNTVRDHGFQGVHLNQAFNGEDRSRTKARYRAVVKALKMDFAPENLVLTSDLIMQDGKISDVNDMFDLVMVNPSGRNYDDLANFFFTPANYLDGKGIRAGNKFVLQVYMFGFLGQFSTMDGSVKRNFQNDLWGYNEICQIVENSGMDLLWDSKAGVAILSNGTRGVVTPTPKSVMATVEFVMTAGLRGVMILSTPEDDFTPYCGKVKYPLSKSANFAMTRAENEALKGKKFCFYKYRNLFQNPSILLPTKTSSNIMYALVNSTIELNCSGIGEPDINLAWAEINATLQSNKLLSESNFEELKDPDCPSNVTKVHKIELSMTTPGNETFQCKVSNLYGSDSNNLTVITRLKPYLLRNNTIIAEEVDFDLNFVLPEGETYWANQVEDAVLFCELDVFETLAGLKDFLALAGARLGTCTHIVLSNNSSWSCDGEMGCSNPTPEQLDQIVYVRENYKSLKVMMGAFVNSNYPAKLWLLSKNDSILPELPRGLKLDGLHVKSHNNHRFRTLSDFVENVKTRTSFESGRELLTVSVKDAVGGSISRERFTEMARHVDFIVLRGHDFNMGSPRTGHNSPLAAFQPEDQSITGRLKLLFEKYLVRNVVLELPTTGFLYQLSSSTDDGEDFFGLGKSITGNPPERIGYDEICSIAQGGHVVEWHMFWDNVAQVPFLKRGAAWISFDSLRSIYAKISHHFGPILPRGVMLTGLRLDNYDASCTKESGQVSLLGLIQGMMRLPKKTRIDPFGFPTTSNMSWTYIAIAALLVLLLVTVAISLFLVYHRNKYPYLTRQDLERFKNGDRPILSEDGTTTLQNKIPQDNGEEDNYTRIPYREELMVSRNDYEIDFTKILGSGEFGLVVSGTLHERQVAVKTLPEGGEVSRTSLLALMNEIKLMMYLGSHPNIVELLGCDTKGVQKGKVYMFLEFCPMGNLLNFLRVASANFKNQQRQETPSDQIYSNVLHPSKNGGCFDDLTLLVWCYQITHGLRYLAHKKIIHGDLSARNVLLVNIHHVKISDFGLSKRLQENYAIYKKTTPTQLPWKWLAPEVLTELKFSIRSDVWALGVTMWEVYSMGSVPYPGLGWDIGFTQRIVKGLRLQPPALITSAMFKILEECWQLAPEDRPSLSVIEAKIMYLIDSDENQVYTNIATGS